MGAQGLRPRAGVIGAAQGGGLARRAVAAFGLVFVCLGSHAQALPACGAQPAVRSVSVAEVGRDVPPAYLNDHVAVDLCHLDALQGAAAGQQAVLHLFINGVDAGLAPVAVDPDAQRLYFQLRRTTGNADLWKPVLHNPLRQRRTTLQLSVGVAGGEAVPGLNAAARMLPFKKLYVDSWTYAAAAALGLVLALTVYLGQRSDMLRDNPSTAGAPRPTYSLARVQMAWWFVLVVAGFMAILLVTGDTDSLPASILALIGISALTGVSAMAVAPSAEQRLAAHRTAVDNALGAVAQTRASLSAAQQQVAAAHAAGQDTVGPGALAASLALMLAAREREAGDLAAAPPASDAASVSQGFWKDIVSDKTGRVALDRLQMVVWSALLGGLYLHSVLVYVTMPDFSATLLGLMGLSSGTYVGFKMPARGQ